MRRTGLLLALLLCPPSTMAGDDASCIADWSAASAIVARERLADWRQIVSAGGHATAGIVRTELCRDGDRYVYRIVVRERDGRFRKMDVDAQPRK